MRLFVVLCVLYPVACLLADDTALNDGSEGPMPVGGLNGPESVIQMVSEAIDVDMGRKVSDVDCHFTFRSHKRSGNAFQLVGFPDLAAAVAEAERRTRGGTQGLQGSSTPGLKHSRKFRAAGLELLRGLQADEQVTFKILFDKLL